MQRRLVLVHTGLPPFGATAALNECRPTPKGDPSVLPSKLVRLLLSRQLGRRRVHVESELGTFLRYRPGGHCAMSARIDSDNSGPVFHRERLQRGNNTWRGASTTEVRSETHWGPSSLSLYGRGALTRGRRGSMSVCVATRRCTHAPPHIIPLLIQRRLPLTAVGLCQDFFASDTLFRGRYFSLTTLYSSKDFDRNTLHNQRTAPCSGTRLPRRTAPGLPCRTASSSAPATARWASCPRSVRAASAARSRSSRRTTRPRRRT